MAGKRVRFQLETTICGLCKEAPDGKEEDNAAAVAYCKTCQAFLCKNCLKLHRRLVAAENHKVLARDHNLLLENKEKSRHERHGTTLVTRVGSSVKLPEANAILEYEQYRAKLVHTLSGDQMDENTSERHDGPSNVAETKCELDESSQLGNQCLNFSEPCSFHFGEMIMYFCQSHKQLCCNVCKMRNHRACGNSLLLIPEVVQQWEETPKPIKDIEDQIREFKDFDKKMQQDFKELKKSKNVFLFDLKEKKKEIMDWLNVMEVRAVKRVETVFDKSKKDIEKKRKNAKQACDELHAETYFLKEILSSDTHDNMYKFIKTKQAEKRLEEIKAQRDHRQFSNSRFGLRINVDFDKSRKVTEQLYEMKIETKGETKYSIRLKDDKLVANVTGCAVMDSGEIVITDQNNGKIKVFSRQFKLIHQTTIPNGVFDVAAISTTSVAATCPPGSKFYIVEVLPELTIAKAVATGHGSCWGINHHNEVFIVNCSVDNAYYVRAVDLESNILFEVEAKRSYASALSWKNDTKQLVISTATSYSDHSDDDMNFYFDELKQVDNPDFLVMQYNFLNHLNTKDVTVDGHGNLVVCCIDTSQIYTISQTGTAVELMLAEADGLDRPQALCYSRDRKMLLVASENTDFVHIFEYEQ